MTHRNKFRKFILKVFYLFFGNENLATGFSVIGIQLRQVHLNDLSIITIKNPCATVPDCPG